MAQKRFNHYPQVFYLVPGDMLEKNGLGPLNSLEEPVAPLSMPAPTFSTVYAPHRRLEDNQAPRGYLLDRYVY